MIGSFWCHLLCEQIVNEFMAVCWKKNLKCLKDMGSSLYQITLTHIPLIETRKHCGAETVQYLLELIFKDSFVSWHNGWCTGHWIKWSTFNNRWMFWNKVLCPACSVLVLFSHGMIKSKTIYKSYARVSSNSSSLGSQDEKLVKGTVYESFVN